MAKLAASEAATSIAHQVTTQHAGSRVVVLPRFTQQAEESS